MDKNNKKDTIKEILNNKNISNNTKLSTNDDESINFSSEKNKEQTDSNNDISINGKSASNNEYSDNSRNNTASRISDSTNNFFIDIVILNELSKSCQLAMNNISFLSNSITNKDMKKDLVAIYSQYANILLQIDQHFEKYGEIPENVSPHLKIMGICSIRMNIKFDKSNSHISEIMIQGENMGIIKCQKLLNGNYDIQPSTSKLLETFKDFQKENIKKLNMYL